MSNSDIAIYIMTVSTVIDTLITILEKFS